MGWTKGSPKPPRSQAPMSPRDHPLSPIIQMRKLRPGTDSLASSLPTHSESLTGVAPRAEVRDSPSLSYFHISPTTPSPDVSPGRAGSFRQLGLLILPSEQGTECSGREPSPQCPSHLPELYILNKLFCIHIWYGVLILCLPTPLGPSLQKSPPSSPTPIQRALPLNQTPSSS